MRKTEATVVKHTGSHYLLTELPLWQPFPATVRGKIRLDRGSATNPVAVGDRVLCEIPDLTGPENPAVICEILPRANCLIRKSSNLSRVSQTIAANLGRAFIVTTVAFPEVKLPLLDRILVTCEAYGVPVSIVLNKTDMLESGLEELKEDFCRIYTNAGYGILETSALTGKGIASLREAVASAGGPVIFSGVSGAGKSSLIKALDSTLSPRTAQISLAHLQGRHTTTFYEMYPLHSGGYVIDSPGIRGFGLMDFESEEICKYFPEMLRLAGSCRFTPCTHTHEPGCAVKTALEREEVSAERYNSYLGMLEESGKYRK